MATNIYNKSLITAVLPDHSLQLEWEVVKGRIGKSTALLQDEIFSLYEQDPEGWLLYLGLTDGEVALSVSLDFWRRFAGCFVRHLRLTPDLETLRGKVIVEPADDELADLFQSMPAMVGAEYINQDVLVDFWQRLNTVFAGAITSHDGTVAEFIHRYSPSSHLLGRIYFHLVENRDGDYPFAFLATYSTAMGGDGTTRHLPLKYALQEYRDNRDKLLELLTTVYQAAEKSALITDLLESNELFSPLAWTSKEAATFLRETPLYEDAGILCRIPDWWKGARKAVRVGITIGDKKPARVGMAALLDFTPHLMIGDEEISIDEARELLAEVDGLAFIKNKWVAVDRDKLEQTLALYEEACRLAEQEGLTLADAMRLQLQPDRALVSSVSGDILEVEHGSWLKTMFAQLSDPAALPKVRPDKRFKAELRPYQQDGLRWLCGLHALGFGACLADDMGLGKTVQLLAFLNVLSREEKREKKGKKGEKKKNAPSLLIIPASLLANWQAEIKRFWPDMRVFFAHPSMHKPRRVQPLDREEALFFDLVITTYALAQRYQWLQDISWNYVILDEAQAIKNPATKQTRAVKELTATNRIAMTGTPVENRLSDFWSLFDFINPGLLGTAAEFSSFAKGLTNHPDGYGRLRRMTAPFILRRLKSDKSIISDLPDKVEIKTWADFSRKQTVIYRQLVEDMQQSLEESEGIQRKGMILAALTKFKQICNHPDQYAGVDGYREKESGKFIRLREICETIHEKREQVLVFTQFKEMTEPLARFLETVFGRPGLVLHGSVAVGRRKKIIDRFQSGGYIPYMVLSLKAGGVGLNLTRANHVIHFDRWWNPAVENQATDRAFRIGQRKKVMVHKFITRGTIEEKIDAMLTEKSQLAEDLVASGGEQWLTEMSNEELSELFSLS